MTSNCQWSLIFHKLWANTDCLKSQEHGKLQIQYRTCSRRRFHLHGDSHHCSSPTGYSEFVTECWGYQDFITLQQPDQIRAWTTKKNNQFSSVTQSCLTLCHPMDSSTSDLPVHHQLPGACSNACPLSRWCHPTISSSIVPFSSCLWSFPASGSFLMSWPFASGDQSIGASALASVLPMNIQGWFPLGMTGWISLLSKGLKSLLQHHSLGFSILKTLGRSRHLCDL